MKPSRTAPQGASKPRVPSPDRANPGSSRLDEGPASQVDGASPPEPAPAAAPLEPPGSPPSPFSSTFNFKDDADAAEWLRLVRGNADDLVALAREGVRRGKHRVLARAEVRRQTREAKRCMHGLLAEAEAGLSGRRATHDVVDELHEGDVLEDEAGTRLVVVRIEDPGDQNELVHLREQRPAPRPDGELVPETVLRTLHVLDSIDAGRLKKLS